MGDYLELLIHTSDTFYRDPGMKDYNKEYDLASNAKQGHLQAVKPVGSPWGKLELDPKRFLRVVIPELQFNPDWLNPELDESKEVFLSAKWRFPIDKLLSVSELEALKNITYNETESKLITISKPVEVIDKIVTLNSFYDEISVIKLHGSAGDFDVEEDGGGDYTSLKTAIETEAADISGGSTDANFFINLAWDNTDTSNWDIDGWTMGSNNMLIQTTGLSRSQDGQWLATGHRIISGGTQVLDIEIPNVTMDGLQWELGSSSDTGVNSSLDMDNCNITNCICNGAGYGGAGFLTFALNAAGTLTFENSIFYNSGTPAGSEAIYNTSADTTLDIVNCTIYGWSDGIERDAGTINVLNSLVFNNTDDFDGTFNSINHCASDDGDGTNAVTITQSASDYAALVTDAPNGDFSVTDSSSELYNAGTNTGAPSDDIIGTSRPQSTTVDIGAFESIVGGATGNPWYYYAQQ